MNTTMLKTNLARGLAIVGRAVPGNPTLPILSHVRVTSVNGLTQQIHLAATDLELSIACQFAAKVADAGAVTLPARTLTDLVAVMMDDMITMVQGDQGDKVQIASGSGRAASSFKGMDANEFPDVFGSDGEYEAEIPATMLLEMAERVVIAAADNMSRPILTGVSLKIADGKVVMSAADGFRLSICTATAQGKGDIQVVVPARAMNELLRIAKDETQIRFTVNAARTRAAFHMAGGSGANETMLGIDLITQLIEGTFPDVGQIVPQSWVSRVTVDAKQLLKAVKAAEIFARNQNHTVALRLADNKMIVSGAAAEVGEGITTLDVSSEGGEGDAINAFLNARFLIDALDVMSGPITLEFNGERKPVVLRSLADDGFVHAIMPLITGG